MDLKQMFKKTNRKNYASLKSVQEHVEGTETIHRKPEAPEGLLRKCNSCKATIFTEDVKNNYYICPKCHGYFRMHAFRRIEITVDEDTFEEWDTKLTSRNPLNYKGYEDKIEKLKEKTKLDEAVITGVGAIHGTKAVVGVMDGRFMMASMGEVVGEKITRAIERATKEKLPVILFACSGGARMQEGIVSLMQMAKTSAALKRHSDAGQLFISILTDPTTGGVTASFAMLGDIILAEPKALIGFAGPRVIEQTIGQKLPKGFQRAEFLLEHGFIDRIVEREEMKSVLFQILNLHEKENRTKMQIGQIEQIEQIEQIKHIEHIEVKKQQEEPKKSKEAKAIKGSEAVKGSEAQIVEAWDRVQASRMKDRPVGSVYIEKLFTDFIEFHGDRYFKDDSAIIGGVAKFHGLPVTVIAQAKGNTTSENIKRNFGMPSPEGYRKALRFMKQAEKFHRPIVCLVDTPGAFCGLEAEERGQGEAIARNLYEMSGLRVPIVSIVIGEGGSGGALAMAVADEVWMLENSIYSILSPEGYATILWKDSKRAKEAANVMKLTAKHLLKAGMIEKVITEPVHLTIENVSLVCKRMEAYLEMFLQSHLTLTEEALLEKRYKRFRNM